MIKRCILYILEHGSVPAVALALAIAPTNSRSRQRDDLTELTKPVRKVGLSERREDSMTLVTERLRARRRGRGALSAKLILRRFDGRMVFVPERQADSSQARRALRAWRARRGWRIQPGVSYLFSLSFSSSYSSSSS